MFKSTIKWWPGNLHNQTLANWQTSVIVPTILISFNFVIFRNLLRLTVKLEWNELLAISCWPKRSKTCDTRSDTWATDKFRDHHVIPCRPMLSHVIPCHPMSVSWFNLFNVFPCGLFFPPQVTSQEFPSRAFPSRITFEACNKHFGFRSIFECRRQMPVRTWHQAILQLPCSAWNSRLCKFLTPVTTWISLWPECFLNHAWTA